MKKILGLDLGTNSIGWAVVNEAETKEEKSSIIKLGVRVNPLTVDELTNFEKGKSITTNADRTLKRSARRNLQRYKLRRQELVKIMKSNGLINDESVLCENGNKTTFETYRLRAKAATEEITLEELARVLLMINKKRGYKSSRKAKSTEEGQLIDGMTVARQLYENNLTPGQFALSLLKGGKKYIPDFYRSDLQVEFDAVWNFQRQFYPDILTDDLKDSLRGKNKKQTWVICKAPFNVVGEKRETKGFEQKVENYQWRSDALTKRLDLESLVVVLQEINGQLSDSSNYLGNISDRSKELVFNNMTVGQCLMSQLDQNPNASLKNKVYYRQDYLDEFERIWETQSKYHSELNDMLKKEIRDVIIFFQRPLRSQKGLVSFCEFESKQVEVECDGKKKIKTVGLKVCPKSSPLYQEFKIWQILNNIQVTGKLFSDDGSVEKTKRFLDEDEKKLLFEELNYKDKLSKNEALKLLFGNSKDFDLNFKDIEGNRTWTSLLKAYQTIIERSGHGEYDFAKMKSRDALKITAEVFDGLGFSTDILKFDASLDGHDFERQPSYQLWHLLYSFEGDKSETGNKKLIDKIHELYGFDEEYASILAEVVFQPDYGSLSAKAIRKILPYMKDGLEYSVACEYAGYRHSKDSLTKEELDNKVLVDELKNLPHNSLRNPVVEKIMNQMINVVNGVVKTYGKPDEIRIELARELKKSAKEREEMDKSINSAARLHEEYVKILQKEPFNLTHVSRNDIIRYKLYLELKDNGFKTLYSNTYIPQEKLFSKEFDIEHIIPQAKLFDDSFANKTIEKRDVNIEKSNATAYDYVVNKYDTTGVEDYKNRVEMLFKNNSISKTKREKLLMKEADIPSGFINRDLRDTQYIARKSKEILGSLVRDVVTTTGSITDRLREDWGLIGVMQELNWDKYNKLGLTEIIEGRDGQKIKRINEWTKRNDHRHHAMDALTIAFTKRSYIQYLNNLNARVQKGVDDYFDLEMVELADLPKEERSLVMYAIEKKELERDKHNNLRFKLPMDNFRAEAKKQLENILISIKAKNKVATINVTDNVSSEDKKNGIKHKNQLTPRGQLHLETIYGSSKREVVKEETVNAKFDVNKIMTVTNPRYRQALLERLHDFKDDPKKAFSGKNSISANPVYVDESHENFVPEKVKTKIFETSYTIRKEIGPDLSLDKVVDNHIREILKKRLDEFDGDAKKAFSDLDNNPIWLNEVKGISIKRVTITGIANGEPIHSKRDKFGEYILDSEGKKQPVDFVNTGNNHHVAVYKDADGNLQENVVSFYEVVARVNLGLPIVDKDFNREKGWQFLFTMKQNEYFVFPNEETGFDPSDIDLLNPDNYSLISPNLFRVQKLSTKDYFFRHHLETTVNMVNELKGITWKRCGLSGLNGVVKIRVNNIGQIVQVGEY